MLCIEEKYKRNKHQHPYTIFARNNIVSGLFFHLSYAKNTFKYLKSKDYGNIYIT